MNLIFLITGQTSKLIIRVINLYGITAEDVLNYRKYTRPQLFDSSKINFFRHMEKYSTYVAKHVEKVVPRL
jgi:hypothetical protein